MITRIEIDGFRSFADFSLDLPPFLAVIGTNASGKSNLVEALRFFAVAAMSGLDAAVSTVRGDPRGLFRQRGDGSRCDRMRFAAEFLFPVHPLFARHLPGGRWRYEVELAWGTPPGRLEGLVAGRQRLSSVERHRDDWPDRFGASEPWRRGYLSYSAEPFSVEFGTGVERERGLLYEYQVKERDVFAPIMVAMMTEFSVLDVLHLEAAALREPSDIGRPEFMDVHGRHLPNHLRWLAKQSGDEDRPTGVVADIETHLIVLVREVSGLEVVEDDRRRDVRLEFSSPYAGTIGAEFASDGTLRILAILAASHDPRAGERSIRDYVMRVGANIRIDVLRRVPAFMSWWNEMSDALEGLGYQHG